MAKENVVLSRTNFETYITSAVKSLRKDEKLCDVTLVCDDGEIRAHRFILSACSPFFNRVVGKTYNHVHPLLYLRGACTRILANILDYMYLGMVNLPQEDLSEMLNLASDLKVIGLNNSLQKDANYTEYYYEVPFKIVGEKKKVIPLKNLGIDLPKIPSKITNKNNELDSFGVTDSVVGSGEVENGSADNMEDDSGSADIVEGGQVEDGSNEEEDYIELQSDKKKLPLNGINLAAPPHNDSNKNKIIEGMLDTIVKRTKSELGKFLYECRVCKKTSKGNCEIRIHAEKHVTGFRHMCPLCGKFYKTRHCLEVHIRRHKKELLRLKK